MYKQLRMIRIVVALLAVQAGPVLSVSSAQGSAGAAAQGSDVEYDALIKAAVTEYREGNWMEARSLFERAHELSPSARTFRGIGLAAFGGKDYVTALGALTSALADERKALTDEQRKAAQELLARAQDFVAKYSLTLTPADAKVRIDAREPVIVDGAILLNPGVHELVVSAEGYEHTTRKLDVAPRDAKELNITLRPEGGPAVAETSTTTDETPRWGLREKLAVGAAATGVVGLGLGAYFGIAAKSKADKADCKQGECDTKADAKLNDQALTFGNISTATVAVGVAGLGASALIYFVRRNKNEKETARVQLVPAVSGSFAGAMLNGSL